MALVTDRVTFQVPNGSTAPIPVSHSLGVMPQYAELEGVGAATGLSTGNIKLTVGCTDLTRHFCYGAELLDNETAGAGTCVWRTDSVLAEVRRSDSTNRGRLAYTSATTTTITFTPTVAFDVAVWVTLELVGGLTQAPYVDVHTLAAASGNFSRTAPGFQPDFVRVFHPRNNSTVDVASNNRHALSRGWGNATAQGCVLQRREQQVNDYTFGGVRTGALACHGQTANASYGETITFVSFDANGYTFSRTASDANKALAVVCFKGVNSVVGTIAAPTSPGTQVIATPGHASKSLRLLARPVATAAETSATVEPMEIVSGLTVSTASGKSGATWAYDVNAETLGGGNVTDPLTHQTENVAYRSWTRTGTDTVSESQRAVVLSMVRDAVTVDWQAVSGNATLVLYASLGDRADIGIEFPPTRNTSVPTSNLGVFGPRGYFASAPQAQQRVNLARLGTTYRAPNLWAMVNPAFAITAAPNPRQFNRVLDAARAAGGSGGGSGGGSPVSSSWPDRRRRFVATQGSGR